MKHKPDCQSLQKGEILYRMESQDGSSQPVREQLPCDCGADNRRCAKQERIAAHDAEGATNAE